MCPLEGEIGGEDLTRLSTDSEVQPPPSPVAGRFLRMTDMDPQPGTIDEQVGSVDRWQAYSTERHEASSVAETGSYDRRSAIDFEQLGKGTKEQRNPSVWRSGR